MTDVNLMIDAQLLAAAGLSVIPIKLETKQPAIPSWKEYQKRIMSKEEIDQAFNGLDPEKYGIAVCTGTVSGGAEGYALDLFDFDNKFGDIRDQFKLVYEEFKSEIEFHNIPFESSQSGGYHLFVRYPVQEHPHGNRKLARKVDDKGKKIAVIETRGEGGYVVVAPSKGYVMKHGDLKSIPQISYELHEELCTYLSSFNEVMDETKIQPHKINKTDEWRINAPANLFTQDDSCVDITLKWIEEAGYKRLRQVGLNIHFQRPDKKRGNSATFHLEKKTFYVFSSNDPYFEADKGYSPFAVLAATKYNWNFREAAKELVRMGFKKEGVDYDAPDQGRFWEEHVRDKRDGSQEIKIEIILTQIVEFLKEEGFGRYIINSNNDYIFVQVINQTVKQVTETQIVDFCEEYIRSIPESDLALRASTRDELLEVIYKGLKRYFSFEVLSRLPILSIKWNEDTKDRMTFFFQDAFVTVTKDFVDMEEDYSKLDGYIWESQKLQHKIKFDSQNKPSDFHKFCNNIVNPADEEKFEERALALLTSIGYLLHRYKDQSNAKAIVLLDEGYVNNHQIDASEGRTGKSLIAKAIAQMRKVTRIDARRFDVKNQFAFQSINLDTEIVDMNDCKKNLDVEALFSVITDDLAVNKKNQPEIIIPFAQSPKFIFTTNYVFNLKGSSSSDRFNEIELNNFYSDKHKPIDDFGKLFFVEWSPEEWRDFYFFMFFCAQLYMQNGLREHAPINRHNKLYEGNVPQEARDFIENYFESRAGELEYDGYLEVNMRELHLNYKQGYNTDSSLAQKSFTEYMSTFLRINNMEFIYTRLRRGDDRKRNYHFIVFKDQKAKELFSHRKNQHD